AVLAVLGSALGVASVTSTQAAWTDKSAVSAAVTAGTWKTITNSCTAMNARGGTVHGGTCSITGVTFTQWSDGSNIVRDYQVGIKTNAWMSYAAFDIDLASGTGTGAWTWGKAATIPTGQFTPTSGFTCSTLPELTATGPLNWGSSYTIWVRVVMDSSTSMGAQKNCR
ncbi:MAG: hypothetical protein KKH75_05980, partial [Actinobacteria bacterium]|nr:hypothetical protein [Actinomycetota bacterium]